MNRKTGLMELLTTPVCGLLAGILTMGNLRRGPAVFSGEIHGRSHGGACGGLGSMFAVVFASLAVLVPHAAAQVCGDGICDDNEDEFTCPGDCPPEPTLDNVLEEETGTSFTFDTITLSSTETLVSSAPRRA